MTDESNASTEVTTEEAKRGKGRPTLAELDARAAALAEKEAELALREREAELSLAEANAALREVDLVRAEAKTAASPARSGTLRNEGVRSDTVTEPLRRRRFHGGEMPTEFHIPEDQIPVGTSYQWNNATVFGQNNPTYDSHMMMQGWRPVDASRHPHLVPEGYKGSLIVKGQILMERPMELTREALQEDYERATGEVRRKEEQLFGARPDTEGGRRLGIKKEIIQGAPSAPNYTYEGGGPVIE